MSAPRIPDPWWYRWRRIDQSGPWDEPGRSSDLISAAFAKDCIGRSAVFRLAYFAGEAAVHRLKSPADMSWIAKPSGAISFMLRYLATGPNIQVRFNTFAQPCRQACA